ncbi:iron ABC transporter permease [Proteiniclasticum sp. QWL-01]|uniref:FecCD family ABC transporter permease n=1 Tax=Proteiniclasticum sp. QWL-01 TaxID=3036945 RepID=UPI00240FBF3F|nr:iron ABC transporter permease [Proteiniclasticum sp. QWL-01]WFF72742.1 iron ABC transporter permease [Proteiniclasticum sp. QWL-01]
MDPSNKRRWRFGLALLFLLSLVLGLVALNISLGSIPVSLPDIRRILFGQGGTPTQQDIIWKIRLPRTLAAVLLGGALALSGFLLQTYFNNPIAGPYVLGISSGSKLAVSVTLIAALSRGIPLGSAALISAAFAGALGTMGFILLAARKVQRSSRLIVSGVMIGYICSALTDFVITFADDAAIVNLHNWSRGSFSGMAWPDVAAMTFVVLPAAVCVFLLSKPIGACQLGESYARNMGVNIPRFRRLLVLLSSVLCACVIAFAGPVSFVGVAVPHLTRGLLGTARPLVVIPACFLSGAAFCLGCDLIARTAFAPLELSISSVTAVIGAPIVISILLGKKGRD